MGATAGTTTATVVGGMTIMAGAGAVAGNGTLANHSNTKWNDHNVALTTINADSIYMDAKRDVIGEGVLFFANNGGAITAGQDVNIESEKVTKYIKDKGWTVTGNVSLGGMLTNTDTINAAVRGGDVVGAMASSNPTFGAIYGLSKMDSPTDFTPLINGGIRAASIANAYGQDLAIQQGAPLLGNNFENTKNALSGGPSVSIGFGTHKSETTWTESYISQFNMGSGSMTIKSGRDINLVGTQIQAEGITLDAGQKLNVLADADYYKNRSSGAGVSVSYGASGWGFGVSANKSKTDSTTYTNAGLNAGSGNLILKSGAEMNIIGANLDGKFIDVDAKGLLTVASVQNTSHSKNSSFGINVNQNNSVSMNGSRGSSDRSFTDNLTTILGTEGVRIHSDTGTVVEGALIANATKNPDGTLTDHGNLTVETPFLSWKDLEDIDVSKQVGGGINVSGDDGRDTSGTKTFSDVWDDTGNIDYRKNETIGVTKATLGNGTITITDPSKQTQDIATLNRDINNVQVITKESETHISITVPLPDAIANPIGNAGGAVANGVVDTAEAAAVTVKKISEAIADQLHSLSEKSSKQLASAQVKLDEAAALSESDPEAAEEKVKEGTQEFLEGLSDQKEVLKERFALSPQEEATMRAALALLGDSDNKDAFTAAYNGLSDKGKTALALEVASQSGKGMGVSQGSESGPAPAFGNDGIDSVYPVENFLSWTVGSGLNVVKIAGNALVDYGIGKVTENSQGSEGLNFLLATQSLLKGNLVGAYTNILRISEEGAGTLPPMKDVTPSTAAPGTEVTTYWPTNDGFFGERLMEVLQPGTVVDRFGNETGKFLAPAGTPFTMRALPAETVAAPYTVYTVTRPITVESGLIAPAFGQLGLGTQYRLPNSVADLINSGHLQRMGQ